MDQTRVNLSTTAMGILAFVLAYFGYVELLFLLIAYAVFLDKNQKLAKISFQALYLQLAYRTVLLVLSWVFGFFSWFFNLIDAYGAMGTFASLHGYIRALLGVLIFVAYLLGVLQIMRGKDCNLPILACLLIKLSESSLRRASRHLLSPLLMPVRRYSRSSPTSSRRLKILSSRLLLSSLMFTIQLRRHLSLNRKVLFRLLRLPLHQQPPDHGPAAVVMRIPVISV
jgi:hypothetical protein